MGREDMQDQDTGCRMPDAGCLMPDAGCHIKCRIHHAG